MKELFTTANVQRALDLPRERLRSWFKLGFLAPTIAAEGQGKKALFNRQDIYKIALFKILVNMGIHRKAISDFLQSADLEGACYISIVQIDQETKISVHKNKHGSMNPETGEWTDNQVLYVGPWKILWDVSLLINYEKIKRSVDETLKG